MKCFNCDEDGHLASHCGYRAGTAPERPPDSLALYRRAAWEISQQAAEWADKIRAAMGWHKTQGGTKREDLQARAARQAGESRSARGYLG